MPTEITFMRRLMLAIGRRPDIRIWRQNVGKIPITDDRGRVIRYFHAGAPTGAADLTGIVIPDGWRLEIEVKGPTGRRSKAQLRWAQFVRRSGGVYLLAAYDSNKSLEDNISDFVSCLDQAIADRRSH